MLCVARVRLARVLDVGRGRAATERTAEEIAEVQGGQAIARGAHGINQIVPVILAVPEEYDKWFTTKSMAGAAWQSARRNHAVIDTSILDVSDVALFFPEDQFANPKESLEKLAKAGSRFGHFSLVSRVAEKLTGVKPASAEAVADAIKTASRQMIRGN